MSTTKDTLNIVLPYCGEAEGLDQSLWLEKCAEYKPTQLNSRLIIIHASTCDMEKYRSFTQRAKEIFTYVVEVVKYKPSPNNIEEAERFSSYCFMTAWPHFNNVGDGVFIDPQWNPNSAYWLDEFLATMRVNQSCAIALGIKYDEKPSEVSGCLGFSQDFFTTFRNYTTYAANSMLFDKMAWEFKKYGYHAGGENYPFDKISIKNTKPDVFTAAPAAPVTPVVEAPAEVAFIPPVIGITSEDDLKASLAADFAPVDSTIDTPEPAKKAVKKTAKKATKRKRAKKKTAKKAKSE